MTRITDPETGLSFQLPAGWHELELPGIPLAAGLQAADELFSPSLIATVSRSEGRPLDDLLIAAAEEWLAATPSGLIIDGHKVERPAPHQANGQHSAPEQADPAAQLEPADFRLLHGIYSLGIVSISLSSLFVLAHGLLTRIDLSMQSVLASEAAPLLYDLAQQLTLPHTAPSSPAPGSAREFADAWLGQQEAAG